MLASQPAVSAPPDADAVVTLILMQDARLLRIGERLVTGARSLCAPGGYSAGITLQSLSQYGADYRAAAGRAGIGPKPTVAVVVAGSAAETAELRVGDGIVAIDGVTLNPVDMVAKFAPVDAALDLLDDALGDGVADIVIDRNGSRSTIRLHARSACRARFDVRAGHANNANTDGTYVQVSSAMLAEVGDDDQLAAVLAHELAHSILGHPQRRKAREPGLSERTTELEADRLSVYLLDAAGFRPAAAAALWQGWGRRHDWGILADRSHPRWKQRVAAITAELATIEAQHARNLPVQPPAELAPR